MLSQKCFKSPIRKRLGCVSSAVHFWVWTGLRQPSLSILKSNGKTEPQREQKYFAGRELWCPFLNWIGLGNPLLQIRIDRLALYTQSLTLRWTAVPWTKDNPTERTQASIETTAVDDPFFRGAKRPSQAGAVYKTQASTLLRPCPHELQRLGFRKYAWYKWGLPSHLSKENNIF